MPGVKNEANLLLEMHLGELGLKFCKEYRFHSKRQWRFDYLLTPGPQPATFALEIEGGIWTRGRHTRGKGYQADLEKYREAAAMGFKVFRFSTEEVLNGTARKFIAENCAGAELRGDRESN